MGKPSYFWYHLYVVVIIFFFYFSDHLRSSKYLPEICMQRLKSAIFTRFLQYWVSCVYLHSQEVLKLVEETFKTFIKGMNEVMNMLHVLK